MNKEQEIEKTKEQIKILERKLIVLKGYILHLQQNEDKELISENTDSKLNT